MSSSAVTAYGRAKVGKEAGPRTGEI